MVNTKVHFTHQVKKIMLQNVVAGVPSLNHVKIQSDHDRAHGKRELSYDNYVTLLLSAASTHDATKGFTSKTKLRAYSSQLNQYNLNSTSIVQHDYDDGMTHNIDSECIFAEEPYEINESHATPYKRTSPNGIRMSKDKWISLSKPEQLAWDTLTNKSKAIILGLMKPQPIVKHDINFHQQNVDNFGTTYQDNTD